MNLNPTEPLEVTNVRLDASRHEVNSATSPEDENMTKNKENSNEVLSKNDEYPKQSSNQSGASKTKLSVKIRAWNGVATWKWIANDDTCGICRVAFDGCCPDCKLPGDDCPLVWGACTHCFHIHCIMKWLNSQQAQHLCPMCRQDWKFKE